MKIYKRILSLMSFASLISLSLLISSEAESRSIQNLNIKVRNVSIESGEYIGDNTITIGENSGGDVEVYVSETEKKYHISECEFVSSGNHKISVGEELKIKLVLSPDSVADIDYKFKSSYSSNTVSISGASYVSSSKKGTDLNLTIKLRAAKGQYEAPYDLNWDDNNRGKALWENADGSSYVDVALYRGNSQIKRVEKHKGYSYNFYPYMIREGSYTFRVRTVSASGSNYGSASAWVESGELYIDEDQVSKGTNPNDNSSPNAKDNRIVGWFKENGNWYYRFPSGELKKDGWEKVLGKWYLFDSNGKMLTGWQNKNSKLYFFNNDGDMKLGWHKESNKWYYLNTNAGTAEEGAMVRSSWLKAADGKTYYIGDDATMSEGWTKIADKWYYFYPGQGNMAVNTTISTFKLGSDGAWIRE
jgi:hypothetical protein